MEGPLPAGSIRRRDRRRRGGRLRDRARADPLRRLLRADRGRPRRRRRDQQGEHGDPAHRLRRQAGHDRGEAGCARPPAARRLRRSGRDSGRKDRSAARRLDPGAARAPSMRSRRRRWRTATGVLARLARTSSTGASPLSRPAPRVRSRSRTRGSSVPSPPPLPARPRRWRGAARLPSTRGWWRSERNRRYRLQTSRGPLEAEYLVNAAGLHSDEVDAMVGRASVHRHAAAGRADRLRQARPGARQPHLPPGADREDERGAGRADGLRQRAARARPRTTSRARTTARPPQEASPR